MSSIRILNSWACLGFDACPGLPHHGYQHLSHVVRPRRVPRVVRDVDDDHVVACAVTARADYLVTGDRDLLVPGHYRKIKKSGNRGHPLFG